MFIAYSAVLSSWYSFCQFYQQHFSVCGNSVYVSLHGCCVIHFPAAVIIVSMYSVHQQNRALRFIFWQSVSVK